MTSTDLMWRVERACLNAWPAPRHLLIDNWLLRCAGGPTRRANSANPLGADAATDDALIDRIEGGYRRLGQRVLVRVPDMVASIDQRLDARGYALEGETRTLFGEMASLTTITAASVSVTARPTEAWLAARDRISGNDAEGCAAYRAVIEAVLLPCGFAAATHEGRIGALAFGAMQDGLLVLESVMTDPALRGQGLARRCLAGLLDWARGQGVQAIALQVAADNAPARGLYESLGLTRDLYGYHYRAKA